jgi:hypothetical protein
VRGAGGRVVVLVVVSGSAVGEADGLTVGPPLVLEVEGAATDALGPQPARARASIARAGAHRCVRMCPNLPQTRPSAS